MRRLINKDERMAVILRPVVLISILLAGILSGCISSEGTGGSDHARTPVQILGPIDTTKHALQKQPSESSSNLNSIAVKAVSSNSKTAPKFKSKQDTLKASVVVRKKKSSEPSHAAQRSINKGFTVQIGAYGDAVNALRVQKNAKTRFSEQPVFNTYIAQSKMYRVCIGRFDERKNASLFLDEMIKKFPQDYTNCWVNSIP